jgi:C-terminal processing protease CtpA/Prc
MPRASKPDRTETVFEDSSGEVRPAQPFLGARRVFLTDGSAVSYAESVLGFVESYKLGEIVGEPTAGTSGDVNSFALPGGYRIEYTGMKVLKQDGSPLHGVGIRPTVPATRTRAGVAAGRDEVLERALALFR